MRTVFNRLLGDLKTIYTDEYFLPKDTFSQASEMWYQVLGNFTADQIRAAFNEYAKTHDRPPMPSQIRELIFDMSDEKKTAPTFDPEAFWREFNYWVLTDLRGYYINEIIASTDHTADDIAEHFKKLGHDMTGTVLKKETFAAYKPKYLPAPNPDEEEIIQEFTPREPLVTSSPTLTSPEKISAFETRRRQLLDQVELFQH